MRRDAALVTRLIFRSLGRHISSASTFVSALLCLAAAAVWIDSYRRADFVNWQSGPRDGGRTFITVEAQVRSGQLQVIVLRRSWYSPVPDDSYAIPSQWSSGTNGDRNLNSLASFLDAPAPAWKVGHRVSDMHLRSRHGDGWLAGDEREDWFYLPVALIFAAFACMPGLWAIGRIRRKKRAAKGLCPVCGYDLIPSPKPVIAILPGDQQQQQQQQPTPPA
jgi:hypothetical protein